MHQMTMNFGCLLGSIIGLPELLSTADRWPFLYLIDIGPLLIAVICLPLIRDSPRYLLLVRRICIPLRLTLH